MKTAKKTLDCVAMKRKGTARVFQLTQGMTRAQELAFWKARETKLPASRKRRIKPLR